MIKTTPEKDRNISNIIMVKIPNEFPETIISSLVGAYAIDKIESAIFTNSKHSRKSVILESSQVKIADQWNLIIRIDRIVKQPKRMKKNDMSMVLKRKDY